MIELFYKWYIYLVNANIPGHIYIYKIMKLIVNLFYPLTIPYHHKCGIDESSDIIVSLTSFPARIKTASITIDTLLRQTMRPRKVILYLAKSQFVDGEKNLPKELLKLKNRGLEIKFCDDIRSHKKYYYSMQEYLNQIVITTDDDMFYSSHFIEQLYNKHLEYPNAVVCNWGHEIQFDEKGNLKPYLKWKGGVSGHTTPTITLSPVGAEGILYPPQCVDCEIFNKEAIGELIPYADDLWLKMMCVRKNTKAVRAVETAIPYFNIISAQEFTLQKMNITENKNDVQLAAILQEYPDILKRLRENER